VGGYIVRLNPISYYNSVLMGHRAQIMELFMKNEWDFVLARNSTPVAQLISP
jgi:hypothetical protein